MYKLLLSAFFLFQVVNSYSQEFANIGSKEFYSLINSGKGIILDVRTSKEYSRGHIENATLISTNDPNFINKINLLNKDQAIYVYCLTGSRSYAVAGYLLKNGFNKVYNLQRGVMEWQRSGYPLTQSQAAETTASKSISTSEFNSILAKNNLVLANFHAIWCAPCKKMVPIIEEIKYYYKDKLDICKIDIETNVLLQESYSIQTVPALILFKDAEQVWTYSGSLTYEELKRVIDKYL